MDNSERKRLSSFDPLIWGMFFFIVWLIVRTLADLTVFMEIISWSFLAISILLFLSIFIPPIAKLMNKENIRSVVMQIMFTLTPLVFALGFLGNVLDVNNIEKNITIIFGILWIIAWQIILVRLAGKILGGFFALLYFYAGINVLITGGNTLGAIFILIIGVIQILVAIKVIPVMRLPIYDN